MEKLDNKLLIIISENGDICDYENNVDNIDHVNSYADFGNKNNITFSQYSHESMGMTLAQLNYVSVINGKAFHIVMLPEQLTIEQATFFEQNKEYFYSLDHIIRTVVYCKEKTDYAERYRKLHKEAMIDRSNISDVDQLYNEIERQKEIVLKKEK